MTTSKYSLDHPIVLVIKSRSSPVAREIAAKDIELHANGNSTTLTMIVDGTSVCHIA
jgi:hypothetical protein